MLAIYQSIGPTTNPQKAESLEIYADMYGSLGLSKLDNVRITTHLRTCLVKEQEHDFVERHEKCTRTIGSTCPGMYIRSHRSRELLNALFVLSLA